MLDLTTIDVDPRLKEHNIDNDHTPITWVVPIRIKRKLLTWNFMMILKLLKILQPA